MTLLEKLIEQNLLKDIEHLINPLLEIPAESLSRTQFLKFSLDLIPTITQHIIHNPEFRANIHKLKLNYYKRNLVLLEILSEKQNLSKNPRLIFKIVRENLSLKNISPNINIYNLYHTYRHKTVIRHSEFLLYEPEEHYKIFKLLSTLSLE